MELRSINEEKEVNIPQKGEVNASKLKKMIPTKWIKLGLSGFVFSLIMCNKSKAISLIDVQPVTSGTIARYNPILEMTEKAQNIAGWTSLIIGIITLILFIIRNKKKKTIGEEIIAKRNKRIKTLFIIFIALLMITWIITFIVLPIMKNYLPEYV